EAAAGPVEGQGGAGLAPSIPLVAIDDEVVEVEDAERLRLWARGGAALLQERLQVTREEPAGAVLVGCRDLVVEGGLTERVGLRVVEDDAHLGEAVRLRGGDEEVAVGPQEEAVAGGIAGRGGIG